MSFAFTVKGDRILVDLRGTAPELYNRPNWAFGVQVTGAEVLDGHHEAMDFAISDQPAGNGGILDEAFWSSGEIGLNGKDFYVSKVPEDLSPELVLERLQALRHALHLWRT